MSYYWRGCPHAGRPPSQKFVWLVLADPFLTKLRWSLFSWRFCKIFKHLYIFRLMYAFSNQCIFLFLFECMHIFFFSSAQVCLFFFTSSLIGFRMSLFAFCFYTPLLIPSFHSKCLYVIFSAQIQESQHRGSDFYSIQAGTIPYYFPAGFSFLSLTVSRQNVPSCVGDFQFLGHTVALSFV